MKIQLLPMALSLGLFAACGAPEFVPPRPLNKQEPASASQPMAPLTTPLLAQLVSSSQNHDKLVFYWQQPLLPKSPVFQTLAVDLSGLAFVQLSVTGPGIPAPIYNAGGLIDISQGTPQIVISKIPKGKNRVVKAQFFNASQSAVGPAVAYAIYSTGFGNPEALNVNRRQRVAAEVLLALALTDPALAENIDAPALQAALDPILYGPNPVGGSLFNVDPALFNPTILAADLLNKGETLNFTLNFNNASYRNTVAGLGLNVTGLIAGVDVLKVQVEDPTSTVLQISANGVSNLGFIAPGVWPVGFKLVAGTTYTGLPETTTIDFGSGNALNIPVINLVPAQPVLDGLSISKGPRGTLVEFQGDFFHQQVAGNKVYFNNGGGDIVAEVVSASKTSLVVRIPAVPIDGNYDVRVEIGSQVSGLQSFQVLKVWHVATDGNSLSNGADWANVTTLQNALQNAQNEDQIWLKAGTYRPDISDRNISFVVNKQIELTGGFAGTELAKTESNGLINPTILSGDLNNNDNQTTSFADPLRAENSFHVVKVETDATLSQLSIQHGHANGSNADSQGGGVFAAIGPSGFRASFLDVTLSHNTAVLGGGFYAGIDSGTGAEAQFYLKRSVVENNQAQNGGGGGSVEGGSSNFEQSLFRNNQAEYGGGLACNMGGESRLTLDGAVFANNEATAGDGGAVNLSRSPYATLMNSVFYQNQSSDWGGGMFVGSGQSFQFNNLIFAENQAYQGGGLWISSYFQGSPKISNSVLYKNQAVEGSGIWLSGFVNFTLQNNLIIENVLTRGDVAAFALDANLSDISLAALVTDGVGGLPAPIYTNAGNHLVADPLFVSPLMPMGIDNKWLTPDDGLGLQAGSPAIDSGANVFGTDILGRTRSNGTVDRGAYEMP